MGRAGVLGLLLLGVAARLSAQDWQSIGPWGGYEFALKAPDRAGQRVYASGNTGLFRSDDRGGRWSRLVGPADGRFASGESLFSVSRADPDVLLAVSGNFRDVLYSSDGGASWRLVLPASPLVNSYVTAVAVSQLDPDRLEVFTADYTAYPRSPKRSSSQDGGVTWSQTAVGIPADSGCDPALTQAHAVTSAVFDASTADTLYGSTVFRCALPGVPMRFDLWADQGGSQAVLAAESFQYPFLVQHSDIQQSGSHLFWRRSDRLARVDGAGLVAIDVPPGGARAISATPTHLLVGTQGNLVQSTDGGASFTFLGDSTFTQGLPLPDVFGSVRFDDGDILASNRLGIFLKQAREPWQPRSRGLAGSPVVAMRVSPDGSRIWASTRGSQGTYHGAYPGSIFQRTSDAGATWQASTVLAMRYELNRIIADPLTEMMQGSAVLYASGRRCQGYCQTPVAQGFGVYKSIDDGVSWQPAASPPDPLSYENSPAIAGDFLDGAVASRTLMAPAINVREGVLRSLDSGLLWTAASSGLPLPIANPYQAPRGLDLIASPAVSDTWYLGATIDWEPSLQVYPTLPAGVFRSVDDGASWQHLANGLPLVAPGASASGVFRLAAHPTDPLKLWAITYERNEYNDFVNNRVFRSVDGAATWFESGAGLPVAQWWSIAVEPQRPDYVYVSGTDGVFFSRDDGASWQRLGTLVRGLTPTLSVNETGVYAGGLFGIHRIPRPDLPETIFRSDFEPE
jgi:photosystem II stability/assembly factor-like uncharacterized protein